MSDSDYGSGAGFPDYWEMVNLGRPAADFSRHPRLGDQVVCEVGGYEYRGKVHRFLGDTMDGQIPEIEIDCGLTTTRVFPESVIKSVL